MAEGEDRVLNILLKANDQASATMERVAVATEGLRGSLKSLKSQFGRGSTFFELVHTVFGAGALAGVGLLTHEIAHMGEEIKKNTEEWRAGKIATGELTENLIGTIPVLGNIWKAGRDIHDLFDSDVQALKDANAEAERLNKTMSFMQKSAREGAEEIAKLQEQALHAAAEARIAGLTGPEKQKAEAEEQERIRIASTEKEKTRAAIGSPDFDAQMKAAKKASDDAENVVIAAEQKLNEAKEAQAAEIKEQGPNAGSPWLPAIIGTDEEQKAVNDAKAAQARADFDLKALKRQHDQQAAAELKAIEERDASEQLRTQREIQQIELNIQEEFEKKKVEGIAKSIEHYARGWAERIKIAVKGEEKEQAIEERKAAEEEKRRERELEKQERPLVFDSAEPAKGDRAPGIARAAESRFLTGRSEAAEAGEKAAKETAKHTAAMHELLKDHSRVLNAVLRAVTHTAARFG